MMKLIAALLLLSPFLLSACAQTGGSMVSGRPGETVSCPEGMVPVNGGCASQGGGTMLKGLGR